MGFRRGFKAEANRISLRVRKHMGLREIDPIDPEAVCTHFDITLKRLRDIDPTCTFLRDTSIFSAVTVPCGSEIAIVHNDAHHPHRQRSNICHELAHCFLGHKCAPPLTEDGNRTHNGEIEAEANFLSGTLLIPNEAAIYVVRSGLELQAQNLYGVSPKMLAYRLKMSGAYVIHERRMQHT